MKIATGISSQIEAGTPVWLEADWPAPPGVRAISTLRGGGMSVAPYASLNLGDHVGDSAATVAENRRQLRAAASLPTDPAWLTQVHGVRVACLDGDGGVPTAPADAAFTREHGRICAILTADCLPILFAAEDGSVVGAAHAGWRGLAAGVAEATVRAMGVPPRSLLAWLGPAIGPRHFEVGEEVRETFVKLDEGARHAFAPNERGRYMADLPMLARRRLRALGITRIHGSAESTYEHSQRYFSYRRDGTTGRQATLIWRVG